MSAADAVPRQPGYGASQPRQPGYGASQPRQPGYGASQPVPSALPGPGGPAGG